MAAFTSIGSEWHKWDLHVHTKSSFDYKYGASDADKKLCDVLFKNGVKGVAITDHFKIDAERIKNLRRISKENRYGLVFFPGVELRTDKGANNLHVIVIFPETKDLNKLSNTFNIIMCQEKAKNKNEVKRIYWSYEDIVDFAKTHDGLISIHAGAKSNGIDTEIKETRDLPYKDAIKDDIAKNVDFFEVTSIKSIRDYKKNVLPSVGKKPLIICSDCHNPNQYHVNETLWIKGDICFETLKETLFQPEERVFVGDEPALLTRIRLQPKNSIKMISIHPKGVTNDVESKSTQDWFDQSLFLNPGMTAIIGNKGSGKTALADIIALGCGCKISNEDAFLSDKKFGNKASSFASQYEAVLEWKDGNSQNYKLDSYKNANKNNFQQADYLPQSYIEHLCNDLGDSFQQEVDKVIFSHMTSFQKKGKKNLQELLYNETIFQRNEQKDLRDKLSDINKQIIEIEKKRTEQYKKDLETRLKNAQDDLKRHETAKPQKVAPPNKKDNEDAQLQINSLNRRKAALASEFARVEENIKKIDEELESLEQLKIHMENLERDYKAVNKEFNDYITCYEKQGIFKNFVLVLPLPELKDYTVKLQKKRLEYVQQIDEHAEGSLSVRRNKLDKEIKDIQENASDEMKKYTSYLEQNDLWRGQKGELENNLSSVRREKQDYENNIKNEYEKLTILNFIRQINEGINADPDKSEKIAADKIYLYNYLYGFSYLNVAYKLIMDGKGVESLSPGERGILLLIFYLVFSKAERPIIIDQPEDNLDNQSVFDKLVPAIKQAKKQRQVIIVTHNPNIAVACDAEQIIYSHMDKDKMEIRYTSGGLENPAIKKKVVDVLEGTEPAFNLRKHKYEI